MGESLGYRDNRANTSTRMRRSVVAMAATFLALAACSGDTDGEPSGRLSEQQTVEIANDTFACQAIDVAGSGMEVDVRTLPNPPILRSGDNPTRIVVGVQATMEGWETAEQDPDTYFRDLGLQVTYPDLPEGSRDGIVLTGDGMGHTATIYVDGDMPGERDYEITWRLGISGTTDPDDERFVDVPCGMGTLIVTPGGAEAYDEKPARPGASATLRD